MTKRFLALIILHERKEKHKKKGKVCLDKSAKEALFFFLVGNNDDETSFRAMRVKGKRRARKSSTRGVN